MGIFHHDVRLMPTVPRGFVPPWGLDGTCAREGGDGCDYEAYMSVGLERASGPPAWPIAYDGAMKPFRGMG